MIFIKVKMRVEITLIIILSLATLSSSTTQVDNLNLLLPQLQQSSRALPLQLITAQGGCYTWTSSAPSVLTVNPHDTKTGTCSKQAVVQVVKSGPYTSAIYVNASDAASQSILNIPVRIRKLNKIFIATKSRMMNLRQIQKLELFAYDSDQNTFTSLEGLKFVWSFQQKSNIIQKVSLTNAKLYLPLRIRQNIEKEGFESDLLVVKALEPGNLKIIVRCIQTGYQHLTDQITLSVHQRFQLKPGPILRMPPSSSYQLFLERTSQEIISLPQPYYNIISCLGFQISNTLYLTVTDYTSSCEIKVQDTRTKPPYSSSIKVLVENPTSIKIISQLVTIVGQKSPYQIQLLNYNKEKLFGHPKNLYVTSDFFIDKSANYIRADRKTVGQIRAQLNQLNAVQHITALLPIKILLPNNYLHLPVEQTFKLRTIGGSGIYDYNINNQIALVSNLGVIHAKQAGQAKLTISDRNLLSNKLIIYLKISTLTSIKSLQQQKEVNKDQWGHFYIIGKNSDYQTFTQCRSTQYTLSLPKHKIQIDKKSNFNESINFLSNYNSKLVQQTLQKTSLLKNKGQEIIQSFRIYFQSNQIDKYDLRTYIYGLENYGICQVIRFRSLVSFEDRAVIELTRSDNHIDVNVPLRVYEPISTNIKDDITSFLLTPLSSLTWTYIGGSYPWPNSYTKSTINNEKYDQSKTLQIFCPNIQKSNQIQQLKLQNEQTKFLLFPVSQKSQINIACKFPKKIQALLDKGDFFDEILVNPNTQIIGTVVPLDESGNYFYNSSNIEYKYEAKSGLIKNTNTKFNYKHNAKSDKIKIYTENILQKINFKKVELQFIISVVEPVKIQHLLYNPEIQTPKPNQIRKQLQIITLYTPKKPYILKLNNASPLISIRCNQSVSCQKKENNLIVNILNLGKGYVSLKDKRIYGSIQWVFQFVIVQVQEVKVIGDRSYIAQGEQVNITIQNLYNGKVISPLLYQDNYLQLILHRNLQIVQQIGNRFLVLASQASKYDINGQQGYPKTVRSKQPFVLNVYERIVPDITKFSLKKDGKLNIIEGESTVIIGCKRILRVKGGPSSIQISQSAQKNLIINKISNNTFSISGQKKGIFSLVLQIKNQGQLITIIKLIITVGIIESAELITIDQPVVGSQFRVIPRFMVGQSEIQGCICDLEYKWAINKNLLSLGISNSFGFLEGGAINATALSQGNQIISLIVFDKSSSKKIIQAQKSLKIYQQINVQLPTIIGKPYQKTQTLRIPPLTSYSFAKDYKIQSLQQFLKINHQLNSIQSSQKLGYSTIKLIQNDHLAQIIKVEITPIKGIFIQNEDGYLHLQPNSMSHIPIYLYDKNGKLFVTPLKNLEINVYSSNPDILKVTKSNDQSKIKLEGVNIGSSILTVSLPGRNVFDSIAVSVGNLLLPSSSLNILRYGTVKYKLPSGSPQKWISSSPQVVQIDPKSGVARALSYGSSKISNGNIFGWIYVTKIQSIEQTSYSIKSQGQYRTVYKALWKSRNTLQQLPNFLRIQEDINNNFNPICQINNNKFLKVSSKIIVQQNHQRLQCIVQFIGNPFSKDLPNTYSIAILDSSANQLARFHHPIMNGFIFEKNKKQIDLNSRYSTYQLNIKTQKQIKIQALPESHQWIKSKFDSYTKSQKIIIDMSNQIENKKWNFDLFTQQLRQKINVVYVKDGEQTRDDGRSFLSFSMDWPEYLILIMGIVFGILCWIQYSSEQKLKTT